MRVFFENGALFVNMHARRLLDDSGVDHVKSSSYYTQGNGQDKAANKSLLRVQQNGVRGTSDMA